MFLGFWRMHKLHELLSPIGSEEPGSGISATVAVGERGAKGFLNFLLLALV
jgi:hypothetical protein